MATLFKRRNLPRLGCFSLVGMGVGFCVLSLFHRIGEGDSYARAVGWGHAGKYAPLVSPQTGRRYFSSLQTGHGDIYTLDENGDHLQRLTDSSACETSPVLSPDGTQIAYIKETWQAFSVNVYKGQVWVMNADGSNPHPMTQDQTNYLGAFFSRDGKSLFTMRATPSLAVSLYDYFRLDLDHPGTLIPVREADYERATRELPRPVAKTGAPVFSEYDTKTEKTFVCLRIPGKNGKPARTLRLHEGGDTVVSPDKKRIAFLAPPFGQNLWMANTDGTALRHVRRSSNHFSDLSFSRDGKSLYFYEVDANGPVSLSRVASDGGGYTQVARMSK